MSDWLTTILIFLLCTIDVPDALAVWSIGVIVTQVTSGKRLTSKLFNIGVGILAGFIAAGVLHQFRGDELGTFQELVAEMVEADRIVLNGMGNHNVHQPVLHAAQ